MLKLMGPTRPKILILTVHNEHHTLADCWRYAIGGDAEIGAHIQPVHFGDGQEGSVEGDGWGGCR